MSEEQRKSKNFVEIEEKAIHSNQFLYIMKKLIYKSIPIFNSPVKIVTETSGMIPTQLISYKWDIDSNNITIENAKKDYFNHDEKNYNFIYVTDIIDDSTYGYFYNEYVEFSTRLNLNENAFLLAPISRVQYLDGIVYGKWYNEKIKHIEFYWERFMK